jgi:hypothetical protein
MNRYSVTVSLIGIVLIIFISFTVIFWDTPTSKFHSTSQEVEGVNPVIGNLSYFALFGHFPTQTTPEQLRLVCHFIFVEQYLRNKSIHNLTAEQRKNRKQQLQRLHEYWTTGVFPRNYKYTNTRKPCFIDPEGRICAVGYLVERSAGIETAQKINHQYQYATIKQMNTPILAQWTKRQGLSTKEIAMIQPQYGPPPQPTALEYTEKISLGVNLGSTIGNSVLMGLERKSTWTSYVGLVSGMTSVGIGLSEGARMRGADLVMGSTSIVLSIYKLFEVDTLLKGNKQGTTAQYYPDDVNFRAFQAGKDNIPGVQLSWQF